MRFSKRWTCPSCQWINAGWMYCENCRTPKGGPARNVSVIVLSKSKVEAHKITHTIKQKKIRDVQTFADGTAWG